MMTESKRVTTFMIDNEVSRVVTGTNVRNLEIICVIRVIQTFAVICGLVLTSCEKATAETPISNSPMPNT